MTEMKWQPIETAPKDERILLICMSTDIGCEFRKGYMAVDMWAIDLNGFGAFNENRWPATHWMPLPAPPSHPTQGDE